MAVGLLAACRFIPAAGPGAPLLALPSVVLGGVVLASWIGLVVDSSLLGFPDDYDTLMYHLPLVDHWLQTGSLHSPDALRWYEPGNNQLRALWLAAPFSGDFLCGLTNIPVAIVFAAGFRHLAQLTGLSRLSADLLTLTAVTSPVFLAQITSVENDLAVAGTFVSVLGYGCRFATGGRAADLALGAVSAGLLAGVKYYALGYVCVAGVGVVGVVWALRGWRAGAGVAAAGAVGMAVLAGYWYARNWAHGGSPLYPLGAAVATEDLSHHYPGLWQTTFLGNGQPERWGLAVEAVWGMANPVYAAALLALPMTVLWLLASGLARNLPAGVRAARVTLAAVTVGAGLVWVVTPFALEDVPGTLNQLRWMYCPVRYGLSFLCLTVIGLAVAVTDLGRLARLVGVWPERVVGYGTTGLLAAAAAGMVLLYAMRSNTSLADPGMIAANVGLVLAIGSATRRYGRIATATAILIGLTGTVVVVGYLSERWHRGYQTFYDRVVTEGVVWHLGRTVPVGSGVCVLDSRSYPYFGASREYRVYHPPVGRRTADLWVDYVRKRDIKVLVVQPNDQFTARHWAANRQALVARPDVFSQDLARIIHLSC